MQILKKSKVKWEEGTIECAWEREKENVCEWEIVEWGWRWAKKLGLGILKTESEMKERDREILKKSKVKWEEETVECAW